MTESISIRLTNEELSLDDCNRFVSDPGCGGLAIFIGTVRNHTKDKPVYKLDFSSYEPMAVKEMRMIAERALEKFQIKRIAIHHAIGPLEIGKIPVIIAVSSPHRDAAFKACQFAIDTLKETVPIWKKEFFDDGEVWVSPNP